jgi:hypothetical protein
MSDHFPALIEIGGPIPRDVVPELLKRVKAEGLRWNWCDDALQASTPEELLAELKQHDSEVLSVGDDEAAGGQFEDLERFLVQHGIAFDRQCNAKYEYDGLLVQFRPGMDEPAENLATQDGDPTLRLDALRPIQRLLRKGKGREALAKLDELLDAVSPLRPLSIDA